MKMRPKVIINAAMSVDGKIALRGGRRIKISSEEDLCRVHQLRNKVDAILVGINTVLKDDPRLTVKEKFVKNPKNPVRVILDSKLRIPSNARVLDNMAPTIVITTESAGKREINAEIIRCGKHRVDLHCALEELYRRGIKSILVEGGGTIIYSFLKEKLVDELWIFVGSIVIGGGAPTLAEGIGASEEKDVIHLKLLNCEIIEGGIVLQYGVLYD